MGWFDLDKPQDVHIALPGDYVHELAFAPDGSRLAVSVTEKWSTRKANRILILDTDASLVWELGETIYPARSLTWSPEGRYLSLLDTVPFDEPPKQNELAVLDVETGERVYSAPVTLANAGAWVDASEFDSGWTASLPADWPGHEWGGEFPAYPRGLGACAARPEPAARLRYPSTPVPAGQALIGVRTPLNRYRNQVTLFSAHPASQDPPDTAAAWIEPAYPGEGQGIFLEDLSPAFSGERIGFVMNRSLYLLRMDGSPPNRIAGPFEHPITAAWSGGGHYVAYLLKHDDRLSDLYILDLACADLTEGCRDQLPGTRIVAQQEVHRLAWSPAGSRLVFEKQKGNDTGKTDLYMVDLQAGSAEPHVVGLTGGMARGGLSTHWLPDGQALVYLEVQPGDPCRSDLIKIGVHDSSIKKILADLSCEVVDFTVSPDGQMLAFVALNLFNSRSESQAISRRVNPSIWLWQVGDEDRSDLVQIQTPEGSQGRISSPVFSFDGKSLLFKTAMERVMHLDLESGEVRILFEVPQPGYQETPWFWPRIFTILFQSP
jgi:Tol biopolymer transport system component